MACAIKVDDLSKRYRLGVINRDMLYKDLQSRWAKLRGRPDPNAPIAHVHQNRIEKGDEFWALRNVDLEIPEGSVFGIIGRNGAGKSTLLKILSQITAPTEGKIKIKGRVASLLEVGTGFHPELTGRENVFLNGAILGMSRREIRSKFEEIVEFSEVVEFIDTPVKRYSSGMYVRLAFGVAAHLDPHVLIVDEVLAVGDAAFQKKCIGKMSKVASEGRTVLLVTHSMALAESLTHSCAWLHDGSLQLVGPTKEVVEAYLNYSGDGAIGVNEGLNNHKLRRGPGNVRVSSFRLFCSSGMAKTRFQRGERISAEFEFECFKKCPDLGVVLSFKLGMQGGVLQTDKICVWDKEVHVGTRGKFVIDVDTSNVPAAIYDLYLWLGPAASEVGDEYYDILDGLVQPVEIFEGGPTGAKTRVSASVIKPVIWK